MEYVTECSLAVPVEKIKHPMATAKQIRDPEFLTQLTFEPLSKVKLGEVCSAFR